MGEDSADAEYGVQGELFVIELSSVLSVRST